MSQEEIHSLKHQLDSAEMRAAAAEEMRQEAEQQLQGTYADSWVPDWEMLQCMKCGVQFNRAWVWRHHCRVCGALVCSSCSQHTIELLESEGDRAASRSNTGRACFTCYQKAVIEDLNRRRPRSTVPGPEAGAGDRQRSSLHIARACRAARA